MFALARLTLIVFVIQVVAYIVLSLHSRSVRRGKLLEQWNSEQMVGDKEAFVDRGLKEYDGSFRRKLILGVFIAPWVAITALIYVVNFM